MAQCHQHFVIARVNGRYRSLAAIHQQWLYGEELLGRCRDTLRILQGSNNRIPIEEELKAAGRRDESFWSQGFFEQGYNSGAAADAPFPFLMTCLVLGTTYGVTDGYISEGTIESGQIEFNAGGNNDGVTLFDITNLTHVRYCIVCMNDTESLWTDRPVQLMAPLSPFAYIEPYYDVGEPNEKAKMLLMSLLGHFKSYNMVSIAVLEDIWPGVGWEEPDDVQKTTQPAAEDFDRMTTAKCDKHKSLRDRAMDKLVQALVNDPDSARQVVSEAEVLTDFCPRLKEALYDQSESLSPSPALVDLLFVSLKNDAYVDLSPFHTFTSDDLTSLVSRLKEHGQVALLNLSNMPSITNKGLSSVLIPGPEENLQTVYLLEDPQISIESLCGMGRTYDLYHSGLLRRSILHTREKIDSRRESKYARPALPPLKFSFTGNAVTQLV